MSKSKTTNKKVSKSTAADKVSTSSAKKTEVKASTSSAKKSMTKAEIEAEYASLKQQYSVLTSKVEEEKSALKTKVNTLTTNLKSKEQELKIKQEELQNKEQELNDYVQHKEELINVVNSSVPKEVLKSEGLIKRLNWYYKDLTGWSKIVAHILLLLFISLCVLGFYFVAKQAGPDSELFNVLITLVLSLFGVSGLSFQAASLKSPKK